jgi:hypothetical protein
MNDDLLALIPTSAVRVKVQAANGNCFWRAISFEEDGTLLGLLEDDSILLHNGKPLTMSSKPGRKRKKPSKNPTVRRNAKYQKQKVQFLRNNALLQSIEDRIEAEPGKIALLVMHGLAQEVASLEFDRQQAEAEGRETSQISLRRMTALKALGEMLIKYPRLTPEMDEPDEPDEPPVQAEESVPKSPRQSDGRFTDPRMRRLCQSRRGEAPDDFDRDNL